ncbi:hypothetical protein BKA70DRAFT_1216650 [Coprinopsis sp. MPI-PUGE-AT-0042]|nr:hypothetical protein BKA70DRAFT_1216650 [Coprinopsis sp. MPI-PUGE-AT-0042]
MNSAQFAPRRPPHCRRCGLPIKGHPKPLCSQIVGPEEDQDDITLPAIKEDPGDMASPEVTSAAIRQNLQLAFAQRALSAPPESASAVRQRPFGPVQGRSGYAERGSSSSQVPDTSLVAPFQQEEASTSVQARVATRGPAQGPAAVTIDWGMCSALVKDYLLQIIHEGVRAFLYGAVTVALAWYLMRVKGI